MEVSRFCIHPIYQKKNFASWLLAKSLKLIQQFNPKLKAVIAYSDKTVGHSGTIYKASGFRQDRVVPPDYWYVDQEGWVIHKRTLYGRAVKMSQTENVYAAQQNYRRIYGSEKLRFVHFLKT